MKSVYTNIKQVLCVKIESGEDILETLQKEVSRRGISSGIILNGIGSVSRYHLHVVETTNLPPGDLHYQAEGAFDVDAANGFVIDGKLHVHMVVSNDRHTYGGHLEPGTVALTFCTVTIAETPESPFS
jgi:predicted DNA-binding protein with PD1-like motif